MVAVCRHINGIILNDFEYLLGENGEIMQFESKEQARTFLLDAGCTEDEIDCMVFLEGDEEYQWNLMKWVQGQSGEKRDGDA